VIWVRWGGRLWPLNLVVTLRALSGHARTPALMASVGECAWTGRTDNTGLGLK
jgi:hypothetical protein